MSENNEVLLARLTQERKNWRKDHPPVNLKGIRGQTRDQPRWNNKHVTLEV